MAQIKLLIVDDEVELSESFKRLFTKKGFDVETAKNGAEAYEKCLKNDFEVVVTDVRMPGGNGIELIEKLRAHFKEYSPVLICMSAFSDLTQESAYLKGVDALFPKPVDAATLRAAIEHFHTDRKQRLAARQRAAA